MSLANSPRRHRPHADGRAKVEIDEIAKNVISNRPGASSCVVWSTKGFPVDNDGFTDPTAARSRPRSRAAPCSASCTTSRA